MAKTYVCPRMTQPILRTLIPLTEPRLPAAWRVLRIFTPFEYTENDSSTFSAIPEIINVMFSLKKNSKLNKCGYKINTIETHITSI